MKLTNQGDYWLAEQRMDTGRLMLAEGRDRTEARRAMEHMIFMRQEYPVMEVSEEFLCATRFEEIFGKR